MYQTVGFNADRKIETLIKNQKKMNYLEIELSLRTMMLLGVLSMITIILIAIWGAKKYNTKKHN